MGLLKQSGIVLVQNWLLVPLTFATDVIVARVLGPEGKGALLLLTGMLAVLVSLFSLGIPVAAAYHSRSKSYSLGRLFGTCLILTVVSTAVAGLVFLLFSPELGTVFLGSTGNPSLRSGWMMLTLACLFPSIAATMGDAVLIVNNEMRLYVVKRTGGSIIKILLTWVLVVLLSRGVAGRLWAQLASLALEVAVFAYWLGTKAVWRALSTSWESVRTVLRIGLQQYGLSLVALVSKRFDTFLISGVLSVREAGYFSIPYLLYSNAMTIPQSTMWPMVSELSDGRGNRRAEDLAVSTRVQIAVMTLLAGLVGMTAPWWVRAVFGDAFIPATAAVLLILPTLVVAPITINGSALLTSRGEPGRAVLPGIIGTAVQVAVSLTLVPKIGILGSSIGLSLNYILVAAWMAMWIVRNGHVGLRSLLLVSFGDVKHIYAYVSRRIRPFGR